MSNDFTHFHIDALAEVVGYLGSNFTYKGTQHKGIINELELSSELRDGGFLLDVGTIVIVQRSLIPVPPKAGETLYVNGKTVRIESVKQDEAAYELRCITASK